MKKKLYIKTALSLMSVALLSSCLKESKYAVNFNGPALVELPGAANVSGTAGPFEIVGLTASSTPTPFNVAVNLAATKPLGSALTVKLSVNADSLTKYNAANGTSYVLLPAADYTTPLSVTIPAGKNLVNMVVIVNTTLLDPTQQYVLPLTITNGGGQQISNYNTVLYSLKVKNAYDGNYTATGYVFHPSSPRPIKDTYAVTTISAVTSQAPLADLGGGGDFFDFDTQPPVNGISALTNWVAVGNTFPAPSSGFMTADNPAAVPYAPATDGNGLPGGAFYNVTNFNNTYVVASKTFLMHFGYGSGSSSQAGFTRQFYMKLVAQ